MSMTKNTHEMALLRSQMDDAQYRDEAEYGVSYIAVPPITELVVPTECEPVTLEETAPPEKVAAYLGNDHRLWQMWYRLCKGLKDDGDFHAGNLTQDGWITLQAAQNFVGTMFRFGLIEPHCRCDVGINGKLTRLYTYRRAA